MAQLKGVVCEKCGIRFTVPRIFKNEAIYNRCAKKMKEENNSSS
ncbi:MAG TPA: hypothetical protein VJP79_09775 [Nitrososphaera sp.]|nr:hypothetical protein [Nitrososphaera sp.]